MGNFFVSLGGMLGATTPPPPAVTSTIGIIQGIAIALLALVGIVVVGVALWIAFRLATAEDQGKRKEAKKQLLWAAIGIVGIAILMVIWFTAINPNLANWIQNTQ